jgi:hypothetical protein
MGGLFRCRAIAGSCRTLPPAPEKFRNFSSIRDAYHRGVIIIRALQPCGAAVALNTRARQTLCEQSPDLPAFVLAIDIHRTGAYLSGFPEGFLLTIVR